MLSAAPLTGGVPGSVPPTPGLENERGDGAEEECAQLEALRPVIPNL